MTTIVNLALVALKVILAILDQAEKRGHMTAGQRELLEAMRHEQADILKRAAAARAARPDGVRDDPYRRD